MSQTGKVTVTVSVGGQAFSGQASRVGEGAIPQVVTLPAGNVGVIASTGVTGMTTGHGIVGTDVVDVHWTDPSDGTHKCRRKLLVDTASTNAITYDETPAAEGDTFPANGTACVVSKRVVINQAFSGSQAMILAAKAAQRAVIDFRSGTAGATSEYAQKLVANEAWVWVSDQGVANPITGDSIITIVATNGSITETILYVTALLNTVA